MICVPTQVKPKMLSFPRTLTMLGDKKQLCDVFSPIGQEVILPNFPQLECYGKRRGFPIHSEVIQSIEKVLVIRTK